MRPAYLVDGITEQRFIQRACVGSPVKITNLNGSSVSAAAIAKRLSSIIRLWKGRYYPVVVLVDLEKRECNPVDFARQILGFVKGAGVDDQVIISVVDRMIENWMIADPLVWADFDLRDNVDGFSGATELKRMMPSYDKAAHGPDILYRSRASMIYQRSGSFRNLRDSIGEVGCAWMNK